MTEKRKYFKNGLLLTLVGLASRTVALFLGAFISRTVGAEGVGLNSLIMNVYAFAFTFATAGVQLAVTALTASLIGEGKAGGVRRILRGAFSYTLIFSSIASLLLFTAAGPISRWIIGNTGARYCLYVLALSLIPAGMSSVICGYFIGVRRVSFNAAVGIVGQVMRVILTVIFLTRYGGSSVRAVFFLSLGVTVTEASVFLVSVVLFILDRARAKKKSTRGCDIRSVAKISFPLALSAYVRSLLLTVEHSLIPKRLVKHGLERGEALKQYGYVGGMALPLLLYPMVPLSAFASLLVPEFAEAKGGGRVGRIRKISSLALTVTLAYAISISVFFLTFSEELGYVVYGSAYAGHFVMQLAPVVPIMYLDHVADNMLKGIGEQLYSMWVNIFDSLLSVFLVFVLLPVFGVYGYALVIIIMECFNFTLSFIRLRRRVPLRINLTRGVLFPFLAMLFASWLVKALFAVRGTAISPIMLTVEIVFTLCIYSAAMILFNLIFWPYKSASSTTISPKPESIA